MKNERVECFFGVEAPIRTSWSIENDVIFKKMKRFVLKRPFLKVDVHTGAVTEGVLTFVLNFALLVVFLKGPRNVLVKVLLLAMATVGLVTVGSGFTGPSMNPANAFGWAYVHGRHESWEHFYVYWVCPLFGAVLAAVLFRVLVPAVPKEEKKA